MPGMAANVAENIMAFTHNVKLITQNEESTKVRYVDAKSNQHIMRFDTEPLIDNVENYFDYNNFFLTQEVINEKYDIVIMSDYDKGFLRYDEVLKFTSQSAKKIYVDSKKTNLSCFENSIIKLNQEEYVIAASSAPDDTMIIKTMGKAGAMYEGRLFSSQPVEVFDVSGAGDTFLSSFAIYHTLVPDIKESIEFANKCAAIVVQHQGTYSLQKRDLIYD